MPFEILLSDVARDMTEWSAENHVIVIKLKSEVIRSDTVSSHNFQDYKQAIKLQSKITHDYEDSHFDSIVPQVVHIGEKDVIFHYIIYDLCHVDVDSYIQMRIDVLEGFFSSKIIA